MSNGQEPLPFGHSADAAVDIEGLAVRCACLFLLVEYTMTFLQLLEDHLKKLREEETGEIEDDEAGWENWEAETDSSESESEGWIDVSSEGEDIEMSDSEDEKETSSAQARDKAKDEAGKDTEAQDNRVSTLATTKVKKNPFLIILDWH